MQRDAEDRDNHAPHPQGGEGTSHEQNERIFDEIFGEHGVSTPTVPPVAGEEGGPPGGQPQQSGDTGRAEAAPDIASALRRAQRATPPSSPAPASPASVEGATTSPLRAALRNVTASVRGALSGALTSARTDAQAPEDARNHTPAALTEPPPPSKHLPPDELESRLKISLRETSVGNIVARVGVGSPKGGVGKSSVAYAVAGSLAYYTNMRICLVDADPNFGSTRLLVPRPIDHSVVSLARDAHTLRGFSDLRGYVTQNEHMRLDVVVGPQHAYEMASFEDLGAAYQRIDEVLSRYYDLIVYDLGLGFRDPAIRSVLALCNELLFVTDSEVIPNAMFADAIQYVENLGVDLSRTTLVLNHRLPPADESAATGQVRSAHANMLRRVTEVPYDPAMSQLLNRRAFHIEALSQRTRLGILTTLAAVLEGLRSSASSGERVSDAPADSHNHDPTPPKPNGRRR